MNWINFAFLTQKLVGDSSWKLTNKRIMVSSFLKDVEGEFTRDDLNTFYELGYHQYGKNSSAISHHIVQCILEHREKLELEKKQQQAQIEQQNLHHSDALGSARFASVEEVENSPYYADPEYFIKNKYSLHLGRLASPEHWGLGFKTSGHIMTIAPTRSGKGTSCIIPNLLLRTTSFVVFDPKDENHKIAGSAGLGKTYKIDPFTDPANSACINPLDAVATLDDARQIAELICPITSNSDGAYFEQEAQNYLTAVIYLVKQKQPKDNQTIGYIRHILTASTTTNELEQSREHLLDLPMLESEITACVRAQNNMDNLPQKTQAQIFSSLNQNMSIFDSPEIEHILSKSSFDWLDLKK